MSDREKRDTSTDSERRDTSTDREKRDTSTDSERRDTSNDSTPLLAVEDIVKTFGGLVAVDGATFDVPEGSITGLIGPNGAGKTTLFNIMTGLLSPDSGQVRFQGTQIQGWSPNRIAHLGVGRTFQTPRIFGGMTVAENLAFSATNQTGETILGVFTKPGTVREEEAAVRERAAEVLDFLELDHLAEEYARGLSGGQRKLLELGRVLMLEPDLIMLDEPVAGINPALTDELMDRLHALNEDGKTLLLIEHDMDVVMNHCDRVVVLHNGQELATGPPSVIQEDERVVEAYLGGVE